MITSPQHRGQVFASERLRQCLPVTTADLCRQRKERLVEFRDVTDDVELAPRVAAKLNQAFPEGVNAHSLRERRWQSNRKVEPDQHALRIRDLLSEPLDERAEIAH